jgi:hypothetical protein
MAVRRASASDRRLAARAMLASSSNPLSPMWYRFSTQAPLWWNTSITFRGPGRILAVEGTRWTLAFNVHGARRTARSKPYLTAMISVLPRRVTKRQTMHLVRVGWFRRLRLRILRLGYIGEWDVGRPPWVKSGWPSWHRSAVFVKELRDLTAVQAEVSTMAQYDLTIPLGPRGRRTRG